MKKLLLLIAASALATGIQAQPWIQSSDKLMKLDDIIAAHENSKNATGEIEDEGEISIDGKERVEGRDYHFSRWVWYWRHHLDDNGYLVSPVQPLREWRRYKATQAKSNIHAKTTNQSQWIFNGPTQHLGSNNGLGRVNVIEFHPTSQNTFIIGTAGGGSWRTDDGGVTWTNLYNNLPVLGVSDIDYNPLNPQTIYICTGDRDAGDTYSVGVLKSTNGGISWDTTGLQLNPSAQVLTNCLVVNPIDTNSLTLATSNAMYKSYDGGSTWTAVAGGNFKQVVYNPADTNVLYGVTYINGTSNIFRSSDGGFTWAAVTNLTDSRRIVLAVTPSNPAIVKAVVANLNAGLQGIYSSSDTGKTFTRIFGSSQNCTTNILNGSANPGSTSCTGQGWYDLSFAISPIDSSKVVLGGINTWQSTNGGVSWSMINQAYGGAPGIASIHADKHYHAFHPLSPSSLYECNDGGVYKTSGANLIWTNLSNGLGITQFYRLATSDIANFVIAGAQDNGTKKMTFANTSTHLTGGDGMDCQMDPTDVNTFYTSSQYGSISRTTNGTNFSNISNNIPGDPTGEWITPFILHPSDPTTIFAGYVHLYMSNTQGSLWTDITPTFSTSGSLMRRIAMTAQDNDEIFILSGNNTLRYTKDLGGIWTTVGSSGISGTISDIHIDPKDKDHLWVTYSGYSTSSSPTHVAEYRIGTGWTKKNDSLPNIPVQCITIDSSNGTIYLGTDFGVFYRDHLMTKWEEYNTGLPNIEVTDLSINYVTNEIWASTYGRGIWKSPRHIPGPNGISNIPYALDVINIAPNPNNGRFSVLTDNKSLIGETTSVNVMSYTGTTVLQTEARFDNSGSLTVNAGNLSRGTYIVEVNKGGVVYARTKMIIL